MIVLVQRVGYSGVLWIGFGPFFNGTSVFNNATSIATGEYDAIGSGIHINPYWWFA